MSAVALSLLIVNVADCVPAMVVEAAEMLFAVIESKNPSSQKNELEPISREALISGIKSELIVELIVSVSAELAPRVVESPTVCRFPPTYTSPLVSSTPVAVVATPIPTPPVK